MALGSKALAWYGPDPELINRNLQCYKLSLMLSSAIPGINDDPVRFRREGGSIPQWRVLTYMKAVWNLSPMLKKKIRKSHFYTTII